MLLGPPLTRLSAGAPLKGSPGASGTPPPTCSHMGLYPFINDIAGGLGTSKAAYKNCSLAAWFVGDGVLDVPGGLMQPHEFCGWQQGTDILEYQNSTPVPATTSTV